MFSDSSLVDEIKFESRLRKKVSIQPSLSHCFAASVLYFNMDVIAFVCSN